MKSLKFSDYISIKRQEYVYIKIIPHTSTRNYSSIQVCKTISKLYTNLFKKIHKEQKKLIIETNFKFSYIIDMTKDDVSFIFVTPKIYENIVLEKMNESWPKSTFEVLESFQEFNKDSSYFKLDYKKEDALSLKTDRKLNEPLNSILSNIEMLKDDDRLTIFYNFMPENSLGWRERYDETMEKIRKNKVVDKPNSNSTYYLKVTLNCILGIMEMLLSLVNDFMGGKETDVKDNIYQTMMKIINEQKELSSETKRKREESIIPTQIALVSHSNDNLRKRNTLLNCCHSYQVLDNDNEFIVSSCKSFKITDYSIASNKNYLSCSEAAQLIQIPGKTLLNEFKISHIKTEEAQVPEELQKGYQYLGESTYKGVKTKAYIEDDDNIGSLANVLVGAQGSGKSTLIKNMVKCCIEKNESIVVLDYIKNCELSEDIIKITPKDKLVLINLSKEECMQSFSYNEISINDKMTTYEKLNLASLQSQQLMSLIDSISIGDPLSSRMRRFLNAAANVTFSLGFSSVKNVVECLEDFSKREKYIGMLNIEMKEHLQDEIKTLSELNEWSKGKKATKTTEEEVPQIIGTNLSKIEHILDRIGTLRENFVLKYMYQKSPQDNIDFVKCLEEGKVIIIQMREADFPTKMLKNILITYFISKIWLSAQLRGKIHNKPLRTNVFIDEVFQAPTCMETLEYILPQSRKFMLKFIFSTQYMKQLDNIFEVLEASGASYMLLKGSTESDFNYFKSKFTNYEYEDLLNLEKYHSLNLIYYSQGYASFITKLPSPIC